MDDEASQKPLNYPQVGSQPLHEFTTQNLIVVCFPEILLMLKAIQLKRDI